MMNLEHEELQIIVEEVDGLISMKWLGNSRSLQIVKVVSAYLESIAEEMKSRKIKVDFSQLNSMNSSTVIPIIVFFNKLKELDVETEVYYDSKSHWQIASFIPLESLMKTFKKFSFKTI